MTTKSTRRPVPTDERTARHRYYLAVTVEDRAAGYVRRSRGKFRVTSWDGTRLPDLFATKLQALGAVQRVAHECRLWINARDAGPVIAQDARRVPESEAERVESQRAYDAAFWPRWRTGSAA